jgi:hypothetical protein
LVLNHEETGQARSVGRASLKGEFNNSGAF